MSGTTLFLKAGNVCQEEQVVVIRRTTEYERVNKNPKVTAAMAVIGALTAVVGIALMINPESEDEETGEKSRIFESQETAYIAGGITIGAGAFILLFPIGDAIRRRSTDIETEVRTETAEIAKPVVRCERTQPARGVEIRVDYGEQEILLGTTNDQGSLSVDLVRVIDRQFVTGPVTSLAMPLLARIDDHPVKAIDSTSGNPALINLEEVQSYFDDLVRQTKSSAVVIRGKILPQDKCRAIVRHEKTWT